MAFQSLSEKFPATDEFHLNALAEVWSEELDRIIKRMFEISSEGDIFVLPVQAKHEATFELAKLVLWLEGAIVEKKTAVVPIEKLDPKAERLALASPEIEQRIENTARNLAEEIWKPLQEEWHRRFPLVMTPERDVRRKVGHTLVGQKPSNIVKEQHYSPSFSNRHWASGPQRKVRVYSRGVDSRIQHRDIGYTTWGYENFLYSQELEKMFGLIESDAANVYSKLLEVVPLGEDDLRYWIAYLTAQVLRTPSYIAKSFSVLRGKIAAGALNYPDNVADLRRGYETLFTNNDVFASFYRQIVGHKWEMWRAPSGVEFIRSDNPVLIEGSSRLGSWRLMYSMSPSQCFVAGPEKAEKQSIILPFYRMASSDEAFALNKSFSRAARMTVIGKIVEDDSRLRALLEESLGAEWISRNPLKEAFAEYWGSIRGAAPAPKGWRRR